MSLDDSPTKFLIRNARVIDGTGSPSFVSSVLIEGDTIVSISSDLSKPEGAQVIDGHDGKLCLCPGFIDMHAHSDLSLLHTPSHEAKITQGVTSEVIGQVRLVPPGSIEHQSSSLIDRASSFHFTAVHRTA
jgi:N-acyl-D-amino-acid deacylase